MCICTPERRTPFCPQCPTLQRIDSKESENEKYLGAERRNVERREFVANFVAERIKAGTWPKTDIQYLVMMNELIDAWENRLR